MAKAYENPEYKRFTVRLEEGHQQKLDDLVFYFRSKGFSFSKSDVINLLISREHDRLFGSDTTIV